jgi:hypothetical protein
MWFIVSRQVCHMMPSIAQAIPCIVVLFLSPVDVAAIIQALAMVIGVQTGQERIAQATSETNYNTGHRAIPLGDSVASAPVVFARNMQEAKKREVLFFNICDFRTCGTSPGHDNIIYACNVLF